MEKNQSDLLKKLEKILRDKKNKEKKINNKFQRIIVVKNNPFLNNKIKNKSLSNTNPNNKIKNRVNINFPIQKKHSKERNENDYINSYMETINNNYNSQNNPKKGRIILNYRNALIPKFTQIYSIHRYENKPNNIYMNIVNRFKTINTTKLKKNNNKIRTLAKNNVKIYNYKNYSNNIINKNIINLNDSDNNYFRRTLNTFNSVNIDRNDKTLVNSCSRNSFNGYKNRKMINIDNIGNNYFRNDDYYSLNINKNDDNYKKYLIIKYKSSLVKTFIKYMKKYLYLHLKNLKFSFLNILKNVNNFQNERKLFLKRIYRNLKNNNYFDNSENKQKQNLSDRLIKKNNNELKNFLDKNKNNSLQHTHNNFFSISKNYFDINKNKNKSLNKISIKSKALNNFDISTLTEEDSQKLSISICSNDIIAKNNNINENKNSDNQNSNKLTMKLKENKNKNYIFRNFNKKISDNLEISSKNKSFNTIYIKKKNIQNNKNKFVNIKLKNKFAKAKLDINKINNNQKNSLINNEKNISSKIRHIIVSKDNKLNISMNSFNLFNYKSNTNKYNNFDLKHNKFSLKIVNNKLIFENNIHNQKKVYKHIKNKNSFMIKSCKEKSREFSNNESKSNKKNDNKSNILENKKIIENFQNNKYLKGCIKFLIKTIKKILFNIFKNLKYYSKYYKLKNSINKINDKKIKEYYFHLFNKKIIKLNRGKNTKGKKIVFNEITKRYELVNNI